MLGQLSFPTQVACEVFVRDVAAKTLAVQRSRPAIRIGRPDQHEAKFSAVPRAVAAFPVSAQRHLPHQSGGDAGWYSGLAELADVSEPGSVWIGSDAQVRDWSRYILRASG